MSQTGSGSTPESFQQLILALSATLGSATELKEIRRIRDDAELLRKAARLRRMSLSLQNEAAVVKLSAERRAGALLASLRLRGGDRKSKRRHASLKLSDLGVTRDQSKRWQREAAVPEAEFRAFINICNDRGIAIGSAALLRLEQRLRKLRRVHT